MNIFDNISNMIHESSYGMTPYNDPMYAQLRGFYAVDRPLHGSYDLVHNNPLEQINQQISSAKTDREKLFKLIEVVKDHHIGVTIKSIIINDCFNSMTDKKLASVVYRSNDEKTNDLFNTEIEKLFNKNSFLEILQECLEDVGIDYGEVFLSTKTEIGTGIVETCDDIDLHRHIAIYKNLNPIGFVRFNIKDNKITERNYISPEDISHFLISPKKRSLAVFDGIANKKDLPEKIKCAEPILTPVIDLIIQYNMLEQTSTAIELNKALAPIMLGLGVSPTSDMDEIRKTIQQIEIKMNSSRNTILNNLNTLDVKQLLQKMNEIRMIPYSVEEGTNRINQIEIQHVQSDLTEKINNARKNIALAIGIPETLLASTVVREKKEETIVTNPRYSRMLSGIQQHLTKGIINYVYKHLWFRFSQVDFKTGKPYLIKKIDKSCIDVKFKSVTNIDERLRDESIMLKAETLSNIISVIDMISGSPNIPMRPIPEKVDKFWKDMIENEPILDMFEIDERLQQDQMYDNEIGYEDDLRPDQDIDGGDEDIRDEYN